MGMFMGEGTPVLLQTITAFEGRGLLEPQALGLSYRAARPLRRHVGTSAPAAPSPSWSISRSPATASCCATSRWPPTAPCVSLAIVEEHPAGVLLEVWAAGAGSGMLILDIGYLEV